MRKGIAFLMLFWLMGCSPGTQVEDIALTLSTGIDEKEEGVTITSEILNTGTGGGKENGSKSVSYLIESVSGKNITDASSKQKLLHPKEVVPLHNKVLVFGENILQSGITDIVLGFHRNNSIRGSTYIVAAKGEARDLLKSTSVDEQSISDSIMKLINRQGIKTKAVQILEEASGKQQDSVISLLETKEFEGKRRLKISGAAVLKRGKLAGYLDDKEMGLIALLQNKDPKLHVTVMYNNEPVQVVLGHSHFKLNSVLTSYRPKFIFNGVLTFKVNNASFKEFTTIEDISNVELLVKNKLNSNLTSLLKKIIVEYQSDAMGFGDYLYRYRPTYWKKNHNKWDTILPEVDIDFKTDVTIEQVGVQS